MKLRSERLTLYRIAGEWAKEVANEPGSLSRDKIFQEFVRSIFRGEFEDDSLAIATNPRGGGVRFDGRFLDSSHEPTSEVRWLVLDRECLLKVTLTRAGTGAIFKNWSWERLATDLNLDDYDPDFRRAYLERLSIAREAFGNWCDRRSHPRPAFWFTGGGRGRKTDAETMRLQIIRRFLKMLANEDVDLNHGGLIAAARELHTKFDKYKLDSIRRCIQGEYKAAQHKAKENQSG